MPRTKPAAERRSDLLDAAQALFVTKGIAATTLDDITRAAGVAKGTFYLYFRSKEDIVLALQERFGERFAARVNAGLAAEDDWSARLDALVEAVFANYAAEHDLHDVLFHHPGASDGQRANLVDAIAAALAAGVDAGAYRIDDVETTAVLLYGALHAAFDASCHGPERPGPQRLVRAAQLLLRRAAAPR